jgi:hypothetical protein
MRLRREYLSVYVGSSFGARPRIAKFDFGAYRRYAGTNGRTVFQIDGTRKSSIRRVCLPPLDDGGVTVTITGFVRRHRHHRRLVLHHRPGRRAMNSAATWVCIPCTDTGQIASGGVAPLQFFAK